MKHDARILICLLVLLAPALAMGFDPVHEWSDSYGGVGPQGVNSRVVIDGSGNIIVAGAFVSMVDFGPLQIAGGGYDFYVAKFDADRNLLWAEGFGGSGTEKLTALDVDSSGYIYLAGHFDEDIDFGGDAHVTQGLNDIFVVKLDPAGESTWSRSYGDDQQDYAFCLAINADDQVVLGGCFEGTVDFGGIPLTNTEPGFDSYLVMLDAAGDHVWSNSYGNDQELAITCLSVDSSSDIVLAGYFLADFDFGGGPLICAGLTDIFVVKLGADGEHIWSHSYGDIAQDGASSLAIDSDDDVLLLGDFIGTVDFGGGGLTSAGSGDYFLVKFQSNGSHAWSHRYGDVNNQAAPWPIVADPLDNVLVTGQFFGDYDVGGEILHSSDSDVLFMMLDTDGNHLWSQNYGDSEDQRSYDIAVDEAGDSYLAGGYAGTLDFGGDPVVCADVQDAFLAKLRLNPKTWLVRLDGTGDATTIQGGIDLAAPGDTVLVACDYYYEHDIVMKSGLTLRSATREAECAVILPQQQGRAIYCGNGVGDVRIEGFTFNSGQADEGGGVCCFNAEAVLTNCDFLGNSADNGGGLYVSSESGDTVELHGCSFIWNSAPAGYGGGACIDGAFLDMSECTFLFNEAQYGGGVAGFGCEGGATHCTLAGNSGAVAGGGMYFDDYSSCGMACSIIAFSQSGEAAYGPPDDVSALDCDVYANAGGDFVAGLSGDEGFNNFSADPLFCNYENWNVSLRSDSPCAQHDPYGQVGSKGVGCWPSVCTDYEQFVHCDGGIPTPYTTDVVISGDQSHAFLSGGSWGLCSVNIAEAPDLEIVGSVPTPGYARRLALSGDYLYIADDYAGLQVAYVAEPAAMELVGPGIVTPGDAVDVAVSGDYAFVAAEAAGVQVIYIAELPDLEIVAAFPPPSGGEARGIVISGNRAYIAAWGAGLQILDISTPTAPSEVDVVDLSAYADGVAISADRNHAYVAAGYAGLEIVSLAGGPPFSVHTIDTGIARDVTVGGELAYVADDVGLVIVGVSDPGNPQILGSAGTHEYANSVAVVGDQGFVAVAYYGLEVVDLSHPEGAPRTGSADTYIAQDVVVSGLHAYIADGSRQLTVVDVSDPSAPVVNDQLEWGSWARAVAISGDYAYLAQDAGIQAVRISDPYAIVPTSGLLATPGQCKDLALSGHYAFIADEGAGLQVVDVANPDTLQLVGGVAIPYYTSGVAIYETYAYVAGNTGLHVVDISIPEAPVLVPGGGFDTPAGALKVDVCRPFLVVADGMSGLLVANLYDPASPVLVGEVSLGGNVLDVDATGSTVYAAVSGVGLVVVDITQPWAPRIVGGYNTPDGANGVRAYGGYVFVADAMSGLQILPAHCDNNPTVGVPETTLTAPRRCQLAQNYPNPFNPSTTILFDLPVAGPATLKVFDLRGRLVRSLVDSKWLDAGRHSAVWDGLEDRGQAMASGVYFYRLEAGDYVQTRRMTLIR